MQWSRFDFPHTQVGWDGVFRAYKFLFSRHDKYKPLTQDADLLYLPHETQKFPLHELVSELVLQERQNYRKARNIGEQDTVFFLATGNTTKEVPWSIERTK